MDKLSEAMRRQEMEYKHYMDKTIAGLDAIIAITGDKIALLTKKSMKVDQKDKRIISEFACRKHTKEEIELALNFYEQIDLLFEDLMKQLNI